MQISRGSHLNRRRMSQGRPVAFEKLGTTNTSWNKWATLVIVAIGGQRHKQCDNSRSGHLMSLLYNQLVVG